MTRTALTLAAGLLPMLVACALMREDRRALGNASRWQHGVGSVPDSVRVYMAANRWATDRIEDALVGRLRAPDWFDTVFAVYWLSDSGRRKYLRTLRRFAGHSDGGVATFAFYGLARHSDDTATRTRILEVYAAAPREVRNNFAAMLANMNESSARSLLAVIDRRDLRFDTIEWIERALRRPALPVGKARWPCLPSRPGLWAGKCPDA
jgi:hypothetical protein